ncbi:hypothetical protein ACIBSV_15550 [Embleya sp. NPDC050154]|uniref:hypothetical protein n=1 Tax=Embleya sp. NPDC050154 TaxID=3363988 RepID=UPI0037A5FB65
MSRHRRLRATSPAVVLGVAVLTSIATPIGAAAAPVQAGSALARGSAEVRLRPIPPPLSPLPTDHPLRPGIRLPNTDTVGAARCPDSNPATAADPLGAGRPDTATLRERARVPGAEPARDDCRGLRDPGRRADPGAAPHVSSAVSTGSGADRAGAGSLRHPAGAPRPAAAGKPPRRAKPPGSREGAAKDRGAAAKRAVHDGPAVIARRAITDHVANTGSAPALPLSVAAGLLLLLGGFLLAAARRRD